MIGNGLKFRISNIVLILVLLLGAVGITPARAATPKTWKVNKSVDTFDGNCNSNCSLRDAVANLGDGDTIKFDSSLSGKTIHLVDGPIFIEADNVTVDGSSLANQIAIDGDYDNGFIFGAEGRTVTFKSLTIAGGAFEYGGGIINVGGDLTVIDSNFIDNAAFFGGAITNIEGMLTVVDSTFMYNWTYYYAGAIFNYGGGTSITGSTFIGNEIIDSGSTVGGAILSDYSESLPMPTFKIGDATFKEKSIASSRSDFSQSLAGDFRENLSESLTGGAKLIDQLKADPNPLFDRLRGGTTYPFTSPISGLSVTNSVFNDNLAFVGGAIAVLTGDANITDSTFSSNQAYVGGALYIDHSIYNDEIASILSSTFDSNEAYLGGGIYQASGAMPVTNSTFYNNVGYDEGGGSALYSAEGFTLLFNNTISDNWVGDELSGASVFFEYSEVVFINTIMANSQLLVTKSSAPLESCVEGVGCGVVNDCANLSADIFEAHSNIIENQSGCDPSASFDDPLLDTLADNEGPTMTMKLLDGSPAIDAGDDSVCDAPEGFDTFGAGGLDQRNFPRSAVSPCDIGAYETGLVRVAFQSSASLDGWILESGENTSTGLSLNTTDTKLFVGDNYADKQYRTFLSFDTSALPDDAVIVAAYIYLVPAEVIGTDPSTTHGALWYDIRTGYFGSNPNLKPNDFQASASMTQMEELSLVSGKYQSELPTADLSYVNTTGLTQFRIHFDLDDNDNVRNNILKLFSGNSIQELRPRFVIIYLVP